MTTPLTWQTYMRPVPQRVPLELVAQWWAECWEWRTALVDAGEGTPYDADVGYRVPRSTTRAKYPWLTLADEHDLTALIQAEARRRARRSPAWRGLLTNMRRYRVRVAYEGF